MISRYGFWTYGGFDHSFDRILCTWVMDYGTEADREIPSLRHSSAMLSSIRKPSRTILIFSSDE